MRPSWVSLLSRLSAHQTSDYCTCCAFLCLLNPIPTLLGGGGGNYKVTIYMPCGLNCAPQGTLSWKAQDPLSNRLETFWQLHWCNLQNRKLIFNLSIVTIATPNVDACFWTTYFGNFPAKAPQNSFFFCFFHEGYLAWNQLRKIGLDIPLTTLTCSPWFHGNQSWVRTLI